MRQFLLFEGVEEITIRTMHGKLQLELNSNWSLNEERYKNTEKLGVNTVLISNQVNLDIEIKPEATTVFRQPPKHLEVLVRQDREYAIIR